MIAEGQTLLERRDAFELMRDQAADQFERQTGSSWRPRSGSKVNHRNMTATMIDSRDFLAAKRRAKTEAPCPLGPKIAFSGGDSAAHKVISGPSSIKIRAKHPDMVLMHGRSPKGAEKIAARWADTRKVLKLDQACQSRTVQAQRPDVSGHADWRHHLPRRAFRTILPTRPESSALQSIGSQRAPHKRPALPAYDRFGFG